MSKFEQELFEFMPGKGAIDALYCKNIKKIIEKWITNCTYVLLTSEKAWKIMKLAMGKKSVPGIASELRWISMKVQQRNWNWTWVFRWFSNENKST